MKRDSKEEKDSAAEDSQPSVPSTLEQRCQGRRVIVVLQRASLETVKTKKGDFQLLNCDDHRKLLTRKSGKDPKDLRPDIVHQELLALLDSPLNKAGKLQIYVQTTQNVLIEVSPQIRIPRTFKRFSGLMVQLLHKLKIRATGNSTMLLRVIKNPITRHLPPGCKIFGLSVTGTLYNPTHLAAELPDDVPIVFYIGAMASGHLTKAENPEIEEMISISEYPTEIGTTVLVDRSTKYLTPRKENGRRVESWVSGGEFDSRGNRLGLSGAMAASRLLGAVETHWGIF